MIDDALVPSIACLLVTALYGFAFVPPRRSTAWRAVASLHGVLFVAGTIYALWVEHLTVGARPEVARLYLVPLFVLFAAGLLSVLASLVMHQGRKVLHVSHVLNLAAAAFLLLVSVVSITHDGP